MNVFILTEGYEHTGYGHVIRCLALAEAFAGRKADVSFVLDGNAVARKLLAGYPVHTFDWKNDPGQLAAVLATAEIVVVDSYLASRETYRLIAGKVKSLVCLDDFLRLDYPAGIVVNGTVLAEQLPYNTALPDTEYLLGVKYIVLRPAFAAIPERTTFPASVHRILITFGGSDPLQLTRQVLPILTKEGPHLMKDVVLGPAFEAPDQIRALGDAHTVFHTDVDAYKMKELMCQADLAISAAGQTINELARTGLPSVIFKVAGNQTNNINGWMETGFLYSWIDATTAWEPARLIRLLSELDNVKLRRRLSEAGQGAVDDAGASRIAKAAIRRYYLNRLSLAEVTEKDIRPLFELANDPGVRANSFSTRPITFPEHEAWFNGLLANDRVTLFIFSIGGNFAGQVRFNREGTAAVISISLREEYRGVGLASFLLQSALLHYRLKETPVKEVYAYVKPENTVSVHSFIQASFVPCESDQPHALKYKYVYEEG